MQLTLSIIVSAPESFPVDYRGFVFVWNVALRSLAIVDFGSKSNLASISQKVIIVKIKTLDLETPIIK